MSGFLVVEDDGGVARSLGRILRRHGAVEIVASRAAAVDAIRATPWIAIIVDIGLPDGSGLDLIEIARDTRPMVPVLVLTGSNQPQHINRAASLGARFVCKPCRSEDLLPFVREAKALAASRDSRGLDEATRVSTARWSFSTREAAIFAAVISGTTREDFLRATGMSPNTYKTHARSMLRKSDAESLTTLALDVLRELAERASPP